MNKFWKDLAERVFWTAAQAGVGVLVVVNTDTPTAYAAVIAAALSFIKGNIARRIGQQETASLTSDV